MPLSDRGPRLIIAIGGRRMAHPLPVPPQYASPCAYIAMLGHLVSEDRRHASWWVDPGTKHLERKRANVAPTPSPTEDRCPTPSEP